MRIALTWIVALGALAGARAAREGAVTARAAQASDAPYAPSPAAAPFVALGYRELAADVLYIRFRGYFGEGTSSSAAIGGLAEAIVALDPKFRRAYEHGALGITAAPVGVTAESYLRAIRLLEAGSREFPLDFKLPNLAGQIYLVDLQTDDPALRAQWDRAGAELLHAAARKPNAPADAGMTAAHLQSKFGQQERAFNNLKELLLITSDEHARSKILAQLAELSEQNQDEIAAELLEARRRFEQQWHAERPAVPASMYILIGPPDAPGFDLGDLAIGGRALPTETFERLEPLE